MTRHVFRAIWPVLDWTMPPLDLLTEAAADLETLARRAHADLSGRPRWSIQPGAQVPGSGGAMFVVVVDVAATPTRSERTSRADVQ